MDIGKLIQDKKSLAFIICCLFIGVMLILSGSGNSDTNVKTDKVADNITVQLEKTLSQVEGAGKVKVLINYSQSGEKILAYDMESNINEKDNGKENNSKSEVVYDGNKMPVILKEYMPKVEGVIIVAQGGNIEGVKQQLISGTVALLGIDSHKIEVLKMK